MGTDEQTCLKVTDACRHTGILLRIPVGSLSLASTWKCWVAPMDAVIAIKQATQCPAHDPAKIPGISSLQQPTMA